MLDARHFDPAIPFVIEPTRGGPGAQFPQKNDYPHPTWFLLFFVTESIQIFCRSEYWSRAQVRQAGAKTLSRRVPARIGWLICPNNTSRLSGRGGVARQSPRTD